LCYQINHKLLKNGKRTNINFRKNKNNRFWVGIVFLGIGGLLYAEKIGLDVPHWVFSWQMLLIVIGAIKGIKNNFHGSSWLILMLFGGIFMWDEYVADHELKKFLIPTLFIALGVIYILKPKSEWRERRWWRHQMRNGNYPFQNSNVNFGANQTTADSSDF